MPTSDQMISKMCGEGLDDVLKRHSMGTSQTCRFHPYLDVTRSSDTTSVTHMIFSPSVWHLNSLGRPYPSYGDADVVLAKSLVQEVAQIPQPNSNSSYENQHGTDDCKCMSTSHGILIVGHRPR